LNFKFILIDHKSINQIKQTEALKLFFVDASQTCRSDFNSQNFGEWIFGTLKRKPPYCEGVSIFLKQKNGDSSGFICYIFGLVK